VTNETHVGRSPASARTDDISEKLQLSSYPRRIWRRETKVLSVLPHSSHNSKGLTVREYVMSCQDVSEVGDRPHALGGCPNTSDGRIAQRLTYLGKHRAFRWASTCRLQASDGCVPQMSRGGFITGHEQMDEEGSARYRWCSSLAQSPKHPDGNTIAWDRAASSALPCFVGQTTCRKCRGRGGDNRCCDAAHSSPAMRMFKMIAASAAALN
jgi:hypothetical protein